MPKAQAQPSLGVLLSTDGEKHAEFKRRRDPTLYMKVPIGGEAPYLAEGWSPAKKLKRQLRLSKPKDHDLHLEDRVWSLFYRMGYADLNKGHDFVISYKAADGTLRQKQVDVFAKDSETVIVGECKSCEEFRQRSLAKDLAEFVGLKKQFANAIRAHYGHEFKPKILWFFFTDKVLWSSADTAKATAEQVKIMTEREIDYFSQLSEHLGRATRYQFLAEYLGGQKIPELRDQRVPAIRGKLGGRTFYSFVSNPDQLLKFCFVNHRTLADPTALPTYQRLVKKSRLKAIGNFIREGGFFPTNILINFDEKREFDRISKDDKNDVQFGMLHLPDKYKSAWIVDGQHRLYGYSVVDPKFGAQNLAVLAFEGLKREEEANLFVTINHEQKSVPRTLLDELDADLKWGSSIPAERLASIGARIVQVLAERVGGPVFRRVVAQGMKGDNVMCLTMPELKGGIVRSRLIGGLAQKRKMLVNGPLSASTDHATVKRAADAIDLFFRSLRDANVSRWDAGRSGEFSTNVGLRALLLLFDALIRHAETINKNFEPANATAAEIADEALSIAKPLIAYLRLATDEKFIERFGRKYGSGGPPEYYMEMAQIIWETNKKFDPLGLQDHLASKDDTRVKNAESTIKFIEARATDLIVSHFKKLHGKNYWNYVGTKEMRVKAYERQQEQPPEEQLDPEAYLDFVDKKRIVEKSENWNAFRPYFDIPLAGEKGFAKNLKWMDRLNELRRVIAHSYKRSFKPADLDFLEWIRSIFEQKLLAVESSDEVV